MDYKVTPYTNKIFASDILSYLNVDSTGDVVSVEVWNTLWNSMFDFASNVNEHMQELLAEDTGLIPRLIAEHQVMLSEHAQILQEHEVLKKQFATITEAINRVDQQAAEIDVKHKEVLDVAAALTEGFVHCGPDAPQNPNTVLWIHPTDNAQSVVGVGEPTPEGGEIFNDYNTNKALSAFATVKGSNNIAGGKCFKVIADPIDNGDGTGVYTLDSVEGLEIGMRYSTFLETASIDAGEITSIDTEAKTITVNGFVYYPLEDKEDNPDTFAIFDFLIITGHPELGTRDCGYLAFVTGNNNFAQNTGVFVSGINNYGLGKYAALFGMDNIAGYNSFVAGYNNRGLAAQVFLAGAGNTGAANRVFVVGENNKVQGKNSMCGGYNNVIHSESSFSAGSHNTVKATCGTALGYNNFINDTARTSFIGGAQNSTSSPLTFLRGKNNHIFENADWSEAGGTECTITKNAKAARVFGNYCHAKAEFTDVSGDGAQASGKGAVARNKATRANYPYQTVIGTYNKNKEDTLFEVGNGASNNARSNAFEVYRDGHAEVQTIGSADNSVVTKKYVDQELASFDFIKVVDELPVEGLPNKIYLVPSKTTTEQDLFDEYIWINKGAEDAPEFGWEFIASKVVEVDLTNYVTQPTLETALDNVNTELNAMRNTLGALGVDYIVEQDTDGIWTWEKWNSGTVKMWCKTTTSYVNEYIACSDTSYPTGITLIEWGCAFVTINDGFHHSGFGLDINAKAIAKETLATVYVHKPSGDLTEDNSNIPISLFVTGKCT